MGQAVEAQADLLGNLKKSLEKPETVVQAVEVVKQATDEVLKGSSVGENLQKGAQELAAAAPEALEAAGTGVEGALKELGTKEHQDVIPVEEGEEDVTEERAKRSVGPATGIFVLLLMVFAAVIVVNKYRGERQPMLLSDALRDDMADCMGDGHARTIQLRGPQAGAAFQSLAG